MRRATRRALSILVLLAQPGVACSEPTSRSPEAASPAAGRESAARQSRDPAEPARPVTVELELIGTHGAGQRTFAGRAPIRLRLTLRNPSEHEVALSFTSGRTHDAVVVDRAGREVWRWSEGRQFTQVLSEIQLRPGAASHFELVCDPSETGGEPLPPGHYEARGVIPAHGDALHTRAIGFEIE
jgi:hypothetical protein